MPSGDARRASTWISLAIGGFLATQVLVPLRGVIAPRVDTRADFSWSMYSHSYRCQAKYADRNGPFDAFAELKRRADAPLLLHREALVPWHHWLCGQHGGAVTATVRCAVDFAPAADLVPPGGDLCRLP